MGLDDQRPDCDSDDGLDFGADTDQPARHGELEVVLLGEKGDDAAEDGLALVLAVGILGDDARANLDLLTELEDAAQDRPARHAALEIADLGAGLVHVERADDDQARVGGKVARWDGDALADVLDHRVDVVLELGRYGHDGRRVGHGALDEREDRLLVLLGLLLADQVDLISAAP